jgi:DnaK suppressor protein
MNKETAEKFKISLHITRKDLLKTLGQIKEELKMVCDTASADPLDVANSITEKTYLYKDQEKTLKTLNEVNSALSLITNGTYGECYECGDDVPVKRLEAQPFSTHCFNCQEKKEKHSNFYRDSVELSYYPSNIWVNKNDK